MELPTVETIGWITRALLATACVATLCYLAIQEKKIDPTVTTVLGYLIGGFKVGNSSSTTTLTSSDTNPTPFKPSS